MNRKDRKAKKEIKKKKMDNKKEIVAIAIAAIMMVSAFTMIAPTAVAQEEQVNTLRIYGEDNFSAAFPYTNFFGPFDASEVTGESPRKDYVTFNPAYMNSQDGGVFYANLHDEGGNCINEKVFLKEWYVPEYKIPQGPCVFEPACPDIDAVPVIVNEYTYFVIDWETNEPRTVKQGSAIVFPSAADLTNDQCGLDSYDVDSFVETNDDDITNILAMGCDNQTNFESLINITAIANGADTKWVIFSPVEYAISPFGGFMSLKPDETVTFMDHRLTVVSTATGSVDVRVEYLGNSLGPELCGQVSLNTGDFYAFGRKGAVQDIKTPSAEALRVQWPWYVYVKSAGTTSASLNIGRLVQEGETFFVDGAVYDVAAIYPRSTECDDFKYITIRNPVLKEERTFGCPLTSLCWTDFNESLPMLPPFNMVHDVIDDINIPNNGIGPWNYYPDNIGSVDDGSTYGTSDHLINELDTIEERRSKDMPELDIYYVKEEKEPRFDTNLFELLNETSIEDEWWEWLNIETMPWNYTEMVYPLQTIDYDSGYPDTTMDFLLTSSFWAPNSLVDDLPFTPWTECYQRVQFVYTPDDGTGIYVNGEAAEWIDGDVNGDGFVDTTDAQWVLQMDAGRRDKPASGTPEFEAADVNEDGFIDSTDAQWILQYDAGRRSSL